MEIGSNLEVEIGSNLVEVLAGTEVAEETVVVLQLSVFLAWEWARLVGRRTFVCGLTVGRKIFSEVRPKSSQFSKI